MGGRMERRWEDGEKVGGWRQGRGRSAGKPVVREVTVEVGALHWNVTSWDPRIAIPMTRTTHPPLPPPLLLQPLPPQLQLLPPPLPPLPPPMQSGLLLTQGKDLKLISTNKL